MTVRDAAGFSYSVIRAKDLTTDLVAVWRSLVLGNPELTSPFFSPTYTSVLARAIPEVFVGIAERNGEPVAFLPFERGSLGRGRRLHFCDYQGIIAQRGSALDVRSLVRGCRLKAWDFDHLLASQTWLAPFHRECDRSPIIDLSRGYDAYVSEIEHTGAGQLKEARTKLRRLERQIGPIEFRVHVEAPEILRQLLSWRWAKYHPHHPIEVVAEVLGLFLQTQTAELSGTLTVLYAGGEVAASHFGLRSPTTWHHWFPAYNPALEKYSPGIIRDFKMAECAPGLGIRVVDFGKGDQEYKRRFMNGAIALAEGSVELPSLLRLTRTSSRGTKKWLRDRPALLRPAQSLARAARKLRHRN